MKPIKSIFSVLSFIVCSFSFSVTHAQSEPGTDKDNQEVHFSATFRVSEDDRQKVLVYIDNPLGEKLTIDVFSYEQGYMLTKYVRSNTYKGSLNFSAVKDGDYIVEVSSRKEKIRRTFSFQTRQVESRELVGR